MLKNLKGVVYPYSGCRILETGNAGPNPGSYLETKKGANLAPLIMKSIVRLLNCVNVFDQFNEFC